MNGAGSGFQGIHAEKWPGTVRLSYLTIMSIVINGEEYDGNNTCLHI
jgi:hypothetical protein